MKNLEEDVELVFEKMLAARNAAKKYNFSKKIRKIFPGFLPEKSNGYFNFFQPAEQPVSQKMGW